MASSTKMWALFVLALLCANSSSGEDLDPDRLAILYSSSSQLEYKTAGADDQNIGEVSQCLLFFDCPFPFLLISNLLDVHSTGQLRSSLKHFLMTNPILLSFRVRKSQWWVKET